MPVISSGNVVDFRPVTLYSTPQRFKFKIVRPTQQRWDDRRNGIEDDACTSNRERPPQCCHHTKANEGELPPQYDKSANSSLESSGFFIVRRHRLTVVLRFPRTLGQRLLPPTSLRCQRKFYHWFLIQWYLFYEHMSTIIVAGDGNLLF